MVSTMWALVVLAVAMPVLARGEGFEVEELAHTTWNGVNVFHAVNKTVIQDILDQYHQKSSNGHNPPQLFIPPNPLAPGDLKDYEHVAYLNFGVDTFLEFEGAPVAIQPCATVSIPLLATSPDGPPAYSLVIAKICQRACGKSTPRPNIAIPHIEIDEVQITEEGAVLCHGNEKMLVSFRRYTEPCKEPSFVVQAEFEEYMEYDMQMGALTPNFGGCDDQKIGDNRFCDIVKCIRCDHGDIGPNFCQSAWHSDDKRTCKADVTIDRVTPYFRDVLLLGADPVKFIATQTVTGHFSIGMKYPCIDIAP